MVLSKLRYFKLSQCLRNLGVVFDSVLNFTPHTKSVVKSGFYHLKNIARVRPFLSLASSEVLMHAYIFNRLDYCNTLLSGLPCLFQTYKYYRTLQHNFWDSLCETCCYSQSQVSFHCVLVIFLSVS